MLTDPSRGAVPLRRIHRCHSNVPTGALWRTGQGPAPGVSITIGHPQVPQCCPQRRAPQPSTSQDMGSHWDTPCGVGWQRHPLSEPQSLSLWVPTASGEVLGLGLPHGCPKAHQHPQMSLPGMSPMDGCVQGMLGTGGARDGLGWDQREAWD